ncbi:MAG: DUF4058 family protein [Cyanobacteria bacterium J06592_8]
MSHPFSGMNPYLEQPEYWSDFQALHDRGMIYNI